MKLVFLLLCTFLMTKVSCLSLLQLQAQQLAMMQMLAQEQNTTRQLKLEISKLKEERVGAQTRTISSGTTPELIDKLDTLNSKLDSLESGLQMEKLERYGILDDLREVKMWTEDLITDTGKEWKNAIANFAIGSRDTQLQDCQELQMRVSKELKKTQAELSAQQSQITELEEAKGDFLGQQKQMKIRLDSIYESLKCKIESHKDWTKKGCLYYKVFQQAKHYDEANATCERQGARLIRRNEVSSLTNMMDQNQLWGTWVENESANLKSCGTFSTISGHRDRKCSANLQSICVKI